MWGRIIPEYKLCRQDRDGCFGAGVVLYIKDRIKSNKLENIRLIISPTKELWVEILGLKCYLKVEVYSCLSDQILEVDLETEK